jgi:dienelactone hydrolase
MKQFGFSLAIVLLSCVSAATEPLTFDASAVGGPASNARAELFTPPGAGPFPAVVVLHGCDGVGRHARLWAQQLVAWGYVAVVVDSFRPRGMSTVCNHGMLVPPQLQALDAFNVADYLRAQPNVAGGHIGVIGFSHGGWAVLKAVLADTVAQAATKPFAAAVAFYPGCDPPHSALLTDTLILIGEADDWTPVDRCTRWRDWVEKNGHDVRMKIYPGALHAFDAPGPPHPYAGHYIGRDPQAAADALAETRNFLDPRLAPIEERSLKGGVGIPVKPNPAAAGAGG